MQKEFSRSFFISANEGNPESELSLSVLVSEMIEISTAHANMLGVGNPDMASLGAGWVLSRLTLEMNCFPKVDSEYVITTWVEGWNRHYSIRDYCISSPDGFIYGYSRSIWFVLNKETHQNFGLSHLSPPSDMISDRECPIPLQKKHFAILPYGTVLTESRSKELIASTPPDYYTFKYNDIDFYRHVNTVKYIGVLLNQYSLEDFDNNFVRRLELSFLHEGKYGETVVINRHNAEDGTSSFTFTPDGSENAIIFARITLRHR